MIARLFCFIAGFAFAWAVLLPVAGWACLPAPGYRVPTNFEIVQRADLIVIVQVDSGPEGSILRDERADHLIRLGAMQVLKGVLPKDPLTLERGLVSDRNGKAFEAMPTPLTTSHFSTRVGTCRRQYFAKGSLVLAMYEKGTDGFRPIRAPVTRAFEDVESYDSLWVRTVRLYVELQARARSDALRDAVTTERDRLRAKDMDMEAQAVAADLDEWLDPASGNSRGWSYIDGPDQVSLAARAREGADIGALRCMRNGSAIEFSSGAKRPSLMIGERRIEVRNGRIAFTAELDRLLRQSAGPVVMTIDGRLAHQAPAGDMFQKFAMRCETLLDR